ncbi:MAG: acetate kinase [Sulfurovum sp.]|nr:acetate kinase [Sulfurovum sp.]
MKILVINAGSSSLKCQYFVEQQSEAQLLIERIAEADGKATLHYQNHTITHEATVKNHHEAMILAEKLFVLSGALEDFSQIDAVGHRVVHGGERFSTPIRITSEVIADIETLIPLAPLHNPANLEAIKAFAERYPSLPQVAVFDTAFHQSMPAHAYHYAIPLSLKEELHIRRYGFHGTSHSYVAKEAAKMLGRPLDTLNLITLHLGNGASACAIQNGKSIDTSMGMTPLEGLVMGTRSGDLDPAILPYLERHGYDSQTVDRLLNKESGLKGLCSTNDMREILAAYEQGDANAILALRIYAYRIRKYIGAYAVALGSVDAIVFTGGIGEHAVKIREIVCDDLKVLGVAMESAKNSLLQGIAGNFESEESSISLLVIPTNEELEIALQTEALIDHR